MLLHIFTPYCTPCTYANIYAMHLRQTDGWEVLCTKENREQAKTVDLTPDVSTPAAKPKNDDNVPLGIECNVFLKDLRQELEKLPEVDRIRLVRHLGKCLDSFLVGESKAVDIESFDIPQKHLRECQVEGKNPLVIKSIRDTEV